MAKDASEVVHGLLVDKFGMTEDDAAVLITSPLGNYQFGLAKEIGKRPEALADSLYLDSQHCDWRKPKQPE